MSDAFFKKSKEIANDFLQSIVFLDDRAYKGVDEAKPKNDFDAFKVSRIFADEKKICAVYQPESEKDVENFKIISQKADAIVLDWEINFPKTISVDNEEEDDEDEPRGIYTKQIIKMSVDDSLQRQKPLKLILVYTGDFAILELIVEEIYKDVFDSSPYYLLDKDNCSIHSSETKILVRAKNVEINNEHGKLKYKDKMVSYEEMPSFILDEFTKMTSGLLSNFALLSLTILRNNSSKILALFSKEVDGAYLSHKSLLTRQEDAEDLLIELFGDTVSDLLFYNKADKIIEEIIESWIKSNIVEEEHELLNNKGQSHTSIQKYNRTHDLLAELLTSTEKNIEKRYKDIFNAKAGISKSKMGESYENLSLNNTKLFLNSSQQKDKEEIDQKFSELTHHKSLFLPNNIIPKLTLGTVVRSTISADDYYICIQQKCDSVRIIKDTERKFLFIPLIKSDQEFNIITPDGIKLKKIKHSYAIRTIKFVCNDESGVILAENIGNDKFIFKQKYTSPEDEQFEWILDLKDLHSQRIIIDYTSQLSRVGLDESEWHRKHLS